MPQYNDVYISQQEFEISLHHGMRYDGFVEGLGYAYTSNFTISPVHFQKYNPPGRVHDNQSFFKNGFVQYLDISPEMRLMSVKYAHKVKAGDTLSSIAQQYGISIQSIKDANSGINWAGERKGDRILAGEVLKLPKGEEKKLADNSQSEGVCSQNLLIGPTIARANVEQRLCEKLYGGDSANSSGGSGYRYGSPESDILWGISASSAVATQINIANSLVETAYRQSILLPRSIEINTGAMTWANPSYAKILKFTKPLGLGGDIANSFGIIYNLADQGVTTENVLDATMGAIGYYPILGDMLSGDYAVQKYNINQVVTGKATLVPGIMGPIYQYNP